MGSWRQGPRPAAGRRHEDVDPGLARVQQPCDHLRVGCDRNAEEDQAIIRIADRRGGALAAPTTGAALKDDRLWDCRPGHNVVRRWRQRPDRSTILLRQPNRMPRLATVRRAALPVRPAAGAAPGVAWQPRAAFAAAVPTVTTGKRGRGRPTSSLRQPTLLGRLAEKPARMTKRGAWRQVPQHRLSARTLRVVRSPSPCSIIGAQRHERAS